MKLILNLFWLILAIPCLLTGQPLSGTLVDQNGRPLTATIALYPLSYRFPITEPLAVSPNRSDFTLKAPVTGIYYLELKITGHEAYEMPIFMDQDKSTPLLRGENLISVVENSFK